MNFGQQLLDCFDEILIINLRSRPDRRAEIMEQFAKIGIAEDHERLVFIAAVKPDEKGTFPSIGARGCFYSHLKGLERAIDQGLDRVLICEDDLDFTKVSGDVLARLETSDWDVFYGGYAELPQTVIDSAQEGLALVPKDQGLVTSHCIGLKGPAIKACHAYFSEMVTREPGDPEGGPMHVDGAYSWFRAAHPAFVTLAAVPPIGVQRPSPSDIAPPRWYDRLAIVRPVAQVLRKLKAR